MHSFRYHGPATAQLQPGHTYPIELVMRSSRYWVHLRGKPLHSYRTLQQLLTCWDIPGFKHPKQAIAEEAPRRSSSLQEEPQP